MNVNELPKMNMDKAETGCCPKFNPEGWDGQEIVLENKKFVKVKTKSFMHIPLNMGKVYTKACAMIEKEDAFPKDYYLILSIDPSPWKGEHYFAVEKDVPGLEMTALSGRFITKVVEGPYKDAPKFMKEMEEYLKSKDMTAKKMYFFYTTCPRCIKHYGKNYMVIFAEV